MGFPRSGNTFLRYALKEMYPDHYFNRPIHTVKFIEEHYDKDMAIMPIRNPKDCISSWIEFKGNLVNKEFGPNSLFYDINNVDKAIKYYIRYFENVLKYKNDILFLNFDIFKNDLEYVSNKIYEAYNIKNLKTTTVDNIKKILIDGGGDTQIPRQDTRVLDSIKVNVESHLLLNTANHIYNELMKDVS